MLKPLTSTGRLLTVVTVTVFALRAIEATERLRLTNALGRPWTPTSAVTPPAYSRLVAEVDAITGKTWRMPFRVSTVCSRP